GAAVAGADSAAAGFAALGAAWDGAAPDGAGGAEGVAGVQAVSPRARATAAKQKARLTGGLQRTSRTLISPSGNRPSSRMARPPGCTSSPSAVSEDSPAC